MYPILNPNRNSISMPLYYLMTTTMKRRPWNILWQFFLVLKSSGIHIAPASAVG